MAEVGRLGAAGERAKPTQSGPRAVICQRLYPARLRSFVRIFRVNLEGLAAAARRFSGVRIGYSGNVSLLSTALSSFATISLVSLSSRN